MTGRPFRFAVLCLLLPSSVWGQQRDAAPGNQVTGRIIMDDGVPVPSSAMVELRCNGRIRRRVRPFTNGDFAVIIGADILEAPDISVPTDLVGTKVPFDSRPAGRTTGGGDAGTFESSGCEWRAVLPGFQSNVIAIGPRRAMDTSEVGRLLLRRIA